MSQRRPYVAGRFYPDSEEGCKEQIEECLRIPLEVPVPGEIVAGLVPHAGWVFSGAVAAKVFSTMRTGIAPETFVFYGAVHTWGVSRPTVWARGSWLSPLGEVEIDESAAAMILEAARYDLVEDPRAHANEHSIEVQVPFIQHLFPKAKIVPVLVPPNVEAIHVGREIGEAILQTEKAIAVIGTTDLTHYGRNYGFTPGGVGREGLKWTRKNDARIIDLILEMKEEEVLAEAASHRNACGAGAIAATIASAKALGAREGTLLEYTTSADVMPQWNTSDAVGYAAIVFSR
jgi:AmmeMemoRadiSam system protein B